MLDVLKQQVEELEERVSQSPLQSADKIAVFDLDDTLLIGDIGDAVFAFLTLQGHRLRLSWQEYQRLLHIHRSKAYLGVVEAMAGLEAEAVVEATEAVMNSNESYLTVQSDQVRAPKPRPLLSGFVSFLLDRQYQVYVLSASNHISVQHVSERWFHIPPSHSFGIQSRLRDGKLTSELTEPVPMGFGKAHLFKIVAGSSLPLITATDSRIDLPLMRLTHPLGLTLWVGDDRIDYGVVMELSRPGQRFFLLDASEQVPLNEF
jgi:phosphoserine phosphatase